MSKKDKGKPPIQLIEPDFIFGIADALAFGADKYGPNDWKKSIPDDINRTFGSIQRHLWHWKQGEINDPESGLNHLLHATSQIMFLYYKTTHKKIN